MTVYLLSAHSIRFDAHGANYYNPAMLSYHKDSHGKQEKILLVPIYHASVERNTCG